MLGIFQSTPRYAGEGQPTAECGGILGMLSGFFGGGLFPKQPAYKRPPVISTAPMEPEGDQHQAPESDPIADQAPNGKTGPVTIVIRRGVNE